MKENKKTTTKKSDETKAKKSVKAAKKEAPAKKKAAAPKKPAVKKEEVKEVPEEKKIEEPITVESKAEAAPESTVEETKKVDEDSDFADEAKPVAPLPAPAPEETKEEDKGPSIEMHDDSKKVEEVKPTNPKEVITYTYDDDNLKGIEDARLDFYKYYKKMNRTKWIITAGSLLLIIAGWIIPMLIPSLKDTNNGFYITLAVLVVALIILGVYSYIFKKKLDVKMKDYFKKFYDFTNAYVFGDKVANLTGSIDDKLDPAVFSATNLYKDVAKVGSRETLHFDYKDHKILLSDCAGQVKAGKGLQTVFVGKLMSFDNDWNEGDVVIYLKGNKRALPPTNLDGLEVYEDSKNMVVYGPAKHVMTQKVRKALAAINTNPVLIDMAVSIRNGSTYFALGYEDSLMILPLDKTFNPAPTQEFKADMVLLFELIDALSYKEQSK